MTFRILETHGCQGGAHAGYVRAGFLVEGVDINRAHARYYPGRLHIGDAAAFIRERAHEFDAVHTSPPCQWYTRGNAKGRATGNSKWQRSIPPIREALEATGLPYVIENVADAAWDTLLGVEHDMTWNGLYECLPPAYTEHVGASLLAHLETAVAA